jgi:hypothetical protein
VKATATATRRPDPNRRNGSRHGHVALERGDPERSGTPTRSEPGVRPRTPPSRGSPHPRRGSWEPPRRPLDHQLLTDWKRPPPSQHGLQRRPDRRRVTSTPCFEVGVDDPFGLVQRRAVRRDQLPPGLGPTAPDALQRGPIGHQIPEWNRVVVIPPSRTSQGRSCPAPSVRKRSASAVLISRWRNRKARSSSRLRRSQPVTSSLHLLVLQERQAGTMLSSV